MIQYFKDVFGEINHIVWPTRRTATIFTVLVIIISVLVAYYLGLIDLIAKEIIDNFIL